MKPEQVTDFKRELASLSSRRETEDLTARVLSLFEKYDLPAEPDVTDKARRRCSTPPVPVFSSSGTALRASGHKTYTGRTAYLLSGGSTDLGWCPALNVLVFRRESWTEEDTYLRIPGGRSLFIETVSALRLVDILFFYSDRWVVVGGEGEEESGGHLEGA